MSVSINGSNVVINYKYPNDALPPVLFSQMIDVPICGANAILTNFLDVGLFFMYEVGHDTLFCPLSSVSIDIAHVLIHSFLFKLYSFSYAART